MNTFPYTSLSRQYTRGHPKPVILDTGIVPMELGSGVLRIRDELGRDIVAYDCRIDQLTPDDVSLLTAFRTANRAAHFWWFNPHDGATYESVYDPSGNYSLQPDPNRRNRWILECRIRIVVPEVTE